MAIVPTSQRDADAAPASGVVTPSLFQGKAGPGYWLREDDEDTLAVRIAGTGDARSKVVRVGPSGIWFTRNQDIRYPINTSVRVFLQSGGREVGPIHGTVVLLEGGMRGPLLGLKLGAMPLARGRDLVGMLNELVRAGKAKPATLTPPAREEIADRARIHALMTSLAGAGEQGRVEGTGAPVLVEGVAQEGLVAWRAPEGLGAEPFVVEIGGYNSVYRLHVPGAHTCGARTLSPMPTLVERLRHRWFRRCRVDGQCAVVLQHPLWHELPPARRAIRDVSYGGICFTTDLDEDLLFPGLRVTDLKVIDPLGREVLLQGEVRFVQPAQGDEPAICGMSVSPWSEEDEAGWVRFVSSALHPTTDVGSQWIEQMWDLFAAAGYFSLSGKRPDEFEELRRGFSAVTERTADEVRLSCQLVWPSARGIEASFSSLKPYSGSWMFHQLAKRRGGTPAGEKRNVLRDIYVRAFEHAQADPDLRWAMAYVEGHVPWIQRSHVAFALAREHTGLAMALPFRLMEGRAAENSGAPAGDLDIGLATGAERRRLLDVLAGSRPAPYLESLDLVPERFDLASIRASWQRAGLRREREVLVARRGSRPVAAAIVESGDVGTNLFLLLDGLRLVSLDHDGRSAHGALLDAARAWYAARGKHSFTYFCEEEDEDLARAGRLRDLGEGRFWAITAELLPDFLEHVQELTARSLASATVPAFRVVASSS